MKCVLVSPTKVLTLLKQQLLFVELGEEINKWIAAGKPGCVQDVFPDLTVDQREMMISGISPEEWDEMFSEEA